MELALQRGGALTAAVTLSAGWRRKGNFFPRSFSLLLQVLDSIPAQGRKSETVRPTRFGIHSRLTPLHAIPSGEVSEDAVSYCERFLELVFDLEAHLPSRRFFNTLLNDRHLIVSCHKPGCSTADPASGALLPLPAGEEGARGTLVQEGQLRCPRSLLPLAEAPPSSRGSSL